MVEGTQPQQDRQVKAATIAPRKPIRQPPRGQKGPTSSRPLAPDDDFDLDPRDVFRAATPDMGWHGRIALAILVQTVRDALAAPSAALTATAINEARQFLLGRREVSWLDSWCTLAGIRTGMLIDFAQHKGWGLGVPHFGGALRVEVIMPAAHGRSYRRLPGRMRGTVEDEMSWRTQ